MRGDKDVFEEELDGIMTTIVFSDHSVRRGNKRQVVKEAVVEAIKDSKDFILDDLRDNQEFCLSHEEFGISIIGVLHYQKSGDLELIIITVYDGDSTRFVPKHGTPQYVVK